MNWQFSTKVSWKSCLSLALCVVGAAQCAPLTGAAVVAPPNVVLLVADDLRADCVGALGDRGVKTPHLDALVRGGFTFRNAYCLGANQPAVCTPSRNMLLSGQTYFRWKGGAAAASGPSLPTAFKRAGYVTYRDGKQSNIARAINQLFDHNQSLADDQAERTSGQPGHTIVDRAIKFLDQRSPAPFCMLLEFEAPHDPRVADQKYLDLYQREQIALPKNYLPVHPFDNGEMIIRDEKLAPWPRSEDEIRRQLHEYYGVISGLDFHIGRLLAALDRLHLRQDTIIVFLSDHGLAIGSHGLMGKQNLYEDGMRVPLVFNGPGILHGHSDALVYLFDVLPTVCDLAGLAIPADIDGKSLAPLIAGRAPGVRDSLFTAYRDVQRAVRDQRWKLIRYPLVDRMQLFDLQNDPDERVNLADDPAQADRVAQLTTLMRQWQHRLGDAAALSVATPRDAAFVPPTDANEPTAK